MNSRGFQSSNPHLFLEMALREHMASFAALEREMTDFVARPIGEFSPEKDQLWAQLRPQNAHLTDEELLKEIDRQVESQADPRFQFLWKFGERFNAEAIPIIILSHSLLEATINAVISIGLYQIGKIELFELLENQKVEQKWELAPKLFVDSYTLRRGTSLSNGLIKLTKLRNAWLHSKIELRDHDGSVVLKGSTSQGIDCNPSGRAFIKSLGKLPYELYENLINQIVDKELRFMLSNILEKN